MEHSATFWLFNIGAAIAVSALTIYCAFGRRGTGKYLCDDCKFNNPESCLKTDRPTAILCTSYRAVVALEQASLIKNENASIELNDAKKLDGSN